MRPFSKPFGNRRIERGDVLDVKLRSEAVRSRRAKAISLGLCATIAAVVAALVVFRGARWALNRLVFDNPAFAVLKIETHTDGVLPPEKIRRWSGVKLGDNLYALDLARVRRDIELAPLVRSAAVERVPPHTLALRVQEREPVAQVMLPRLGEPTIYYLDAEGFVMAPPPSVPQEQFTRGAGDALPVILGIHPTELRAGRRVESSSALAALRFLGAFERSALFGVEDVRVVDTSSPGVLRMATPRGGEITFSSESFDAQLRRWRVIYDEGLRQGKAIALLDLSITNNLPVRWVDAAAAPAPRPKPPRARLPKRHV